MEGINVDTIPTSLLARILLQLDVLPKAENINLLSILQAALRDYGLKNDLDAFLNYCQTLAPVNHNPNDQHQSDWLWQSYEIRSDEDWDLANYKKTGQVVGLRFLMTSDTARKGIDLTRLSLVHMNDEKSLYMYQGRAYPIEALINDTLSYFRQKCALIDSETDSGTTKHEIESSGLLDMLQQRSAKCRQDKEAVQQRTDKLDHTDYHLRGVLMVRYDALNRETTTVDTWCLYLRDYIREGGEGNAWRIFVQNEEKMVITSEQALADIRGVPYGRCTPSLFSRDYRPAYVFYGNISLMTSLTTPINNAASTKTVQPQQLSNQDNPHSTAITLADYTFDDDEYDPTKFDENYMEEDDDTLCYHCSSGIVDDPENDIFICDACNCGFHQLCENPPIQAWEKQLDPWVCRTCLKAQYTSISKAGSADQAPLNDSATLANQAANIPSAVWTNNVSATLNTASASSVTASSSHSSSQPAAGHTDGRIKSSSLTAALMSPEDDNLDSYSNNNSKRRREGEDMAHNHHSQSRIRRDADERQDEHSHSMGS